MYYHLLIPGYLQKPYTYFFHETLQKGQIVTVQFRNREILAIVLEVVSRPNFETKSIQRITQIQLCPKIINYIIWLSHYTLSPLGLIMKMFLAFKFQDVEKIKPSGFENWNSFNKKNLTDEQKEALKKLIENFNSFNVSLLDGVTGSGKTEVYLSLAAKVLEAGKQVLILQPEIALTNQLLARIEQYFNQQPYCWHSHSTKKLKCYSWVLSGKSGIIIGARSALFLPYKNLGLIIIDEEHDNSYKQEEMPLYHARDMGVMRAKMENIPIVLSSATPSLESFYNVLQKRYHHIQLLNRFAKASIPQVHIVDMKKELAQEQWISKPLHSAIEKNLLKGDQTLLFLNKRGYAPLTLCKCCGYHFMCPHCDIWLVQHHYKKCFLCHHCGFEKSLSACCPQCNESQCFIPCGPGVERIAEEVSIKFPGARILVVTSDLMPTSKKMQEALNKIQNKEIDIIIGTQILAKGHHFSRLNLVGIIDADSGMGGTDLKGLEKNYQLLHQVSGRAGRESKDGEVFIQTYLPNHPLIQCMEKFDRDLFYNLEIEDRKTHNMPPFTRLAALIVSSTKSSEVENFVKTLSSYIIRIPKIIVLGPTPAPIAKIREYYRWRFLIKAEKDISVQNYLQKWIEKVKIPYSIHLTIDIDPQTFF